MKRLNGRRMGRRWSSWALVFCAVIAWTIVHRTWPTFAIQVEAAVAAVSAAIVLMTHR